MKPVFFHPEAEDELYSTVDYYDSCSVGLGQRFLVCVRRGINSIAEAPKASPIVSGEIRRLLLRPFPYGLLFREYPDKTMIIAVMHLHRKPGYWMSRQSES